MVGVLILWMLVGHMMWLLIMVSPLNFEDSFFKCIRLMLVSWVIGPVVWLIATHDAFYGRYSKRKRRVMVVDDGV